MKKPFDSKVEYQRDDSVPMLEFRYRGNRMSQGEMLTAVLSASFGITAPLMAIPIIRSRVKRNLLRVDRDAITVDKHRYERDNVQRVRTFTWAGQQSNMSAAGTTTALVFDYGTKRKTMACRLSEPELLWMYAEVQDFMGRFWTDLGPQRL
ncbi:MAG TPA: hypothetical protein VG389_08750 [Myxococcota bacterium]|nr:hypothetical protein [Myxococcota bacterium]